MAGPAADLDQCGDPLSEQPRVDALAGGQYPADQVVAGHEGEGRLVVVPAAAHLLLREGDTGGLDADHDPAALGLRHDPVPELQALRGHDTRQYDLKQALVSHDRALLLRSADAFAFVISYNSIGS